VKFAPGLSTLFGYYPAPAKAMMIARPPRREWSSIMPTDLNYLHRFVRCVPQAQPWSSGTIGARSRQVPVLAGLLLGLILIALSPTSRASATTIAIDTSNSSDFTMVDRNGASITPVDLGTVIGAPAQSYYEASFAFNLPLGATNTNLSWTNFAADDRSVMLLNGTVLQGVGIFGPGVGTFQFAATLSNDPFTFAGNGSSGSATTPFLLGANVLTFVVNDTGGGISGAVGPDGVRTTSVSFQGAITYDTVVIAGGVPEPATWAMMLLGFAGIGVMARRRRRAIA
jgi:hypothetical protein